MQHNFFKTVIYLVLSCSTFCLTNSFAQSGCSAVINAVSINPGDCNGGADCETPSEYMEIFNPCFEPLELGCAALCSGDWCVSVPTGTVLMPGEYMAIGSATSPGFDAENSRHLDLHNCDGCACSNAASETSELGALSDENGQIALFDAEGKLLQGLVWGGGQGTFPVDLIIEEAGGCAARTLTLPDPASNEQFIELPEIESNCSFSVKVNNTVSKICETEEGDISMGATNLRFLPFIISGCLYTGETVNVTLNTEGKASSPFWTIPCSNSFPDLSAPSVDVFCDQAGTKTIHVLVLNETNGHTYQYQQDLEILPGLDNVKELTDKEVCAGENISFEIPVLEGLDSQILVINNPPNEPQTLTSDFKVDIQNIEETSTITLTGFGGGENCEFKKEVTISVLAVDDPLCFTAVEDYIVLLNSRVSPNPAKHFVQLQFELSENKESNLSLYNVHGQKVYEQNDLSFAGTNLQKVDIEELPSGVYMLRLILDKESRHFKFIKE